MATYNIVNSIPNTNSGNKTITIVPDVGYSLPSSITVTDGTLVSYDSSTGVAVVSGDNAIINAVCVKSYLTFYSENLAFTLSVKDNSPYWDGTIEYSTDLQTWTVWDGSAAINSSAPSAMDNNTYLYLRGTGNTRISYNNGHRWIFSKSGSPYKIYCDGNIETLLDYQTVVAGNHPPMANRCFGAMFYDDGYLVNTPELPATTLSNICYADMFYHCTSLTVAPVLPATTLAQYCYDGMFSGCTALTTPAIMAGGSIQATPAQYCCRMMYSACTSLQIYTTSENHIPFYKAMNYSTGTSSASSYYSTDRMFSNCYIDGTKSTATYLPAGTQYYY